jgi:hypothetical protein
MLDIIISAVLGALTAATAYMGVYVTLHPPAEEQKSAWKSWFIAIAILGVGLIVLQGYRARSASQELQAQLDKIQHNTETPPQVTVNVPPSPAPSPPSQHTHLTFLKGEIWKNSLPPFTSGMQPAMHIIYDNGGDFTIKNPRQRAVVVLVNASEINRSFQDHKKDVLKAFVSNGGDVPPHSPMIQYHTFSGPILTNADVADLNRQADDPQKKILCGFSIISWNDDSGAYETSFAQCLSSESPGVWNWHVLRENDHEVKVK